MKRWLLLYEVVSDYVIRRAPLREEHLRLARDAHARGELELAGAYGAGFDDESPVVAGAALVFNGSTRSTAERFASRDPYVKNGLVTKWSVFEWKVVVGRSPT
jgi:uncharacterized protein YciI